MWMLLSAHLFSWLTLFWEGGMRTFVRSDWGRGLPWSFYKFQEIYGPGIFVILGGLAANTLFWMAVFLILKKILKYLPKSFSLTLLVASILSPLTVLFTYKHITSGYTGTHVVICDYLRGWPFAFGHPVSWGVGDIPCSSVFKFWPFLLDLLVWVLFYFLLIKIIRLIKSRSTTAPSKI